MVLKKSIPFFLSVCLLAACGEEAKPVENTKPVSNEPISLEDARAVYTLNCASCHGPDGTLKASNAKDLSISKMNESEIEQMIRKGNDKGMMPYEEMLSTAEIKGLVKFVQNLRK
ncbi:MAG: cytochrome c class [Fluviicola sp.]|jgi:mono/diheme cytochrome c family protein|uniref:c-type cytochrome n=1 Tax=Fluviicola sp. TaxID=1917219 RepID=UPI002602CF88|nr:cytochrome c [Fluviicola sp.]MDF3027598.1 cytochrome c class [Fluviicola sp.]